MAEEPQQLKNDIEGTRSQLSADLDALSERVSPANVAQRQVDKAKAGVVGVKDRIMGSAHDAGDSARDTLDSAKDSAQGSATGNVSAVKTRTQGNPLAAGVVAFGAGLLLASLFPASAKETDATQNLLETVKDKGAPVLDEAKNVASDVGASLKDHATDAAAQVKDSARDAAGTVRGDAREAAGTVQQHGADAAQHVKSDAADAKKS